ncbi:hypothetical protein Vretimale_3165 [Volvox reticuliferus]|uniref:Flavanone 4-reductase n=1 Tax=Volvox reticuliferus TaxID=1737510 RepID=A0A8J4C946_9CHLO|nr:hypothetical protein Vretifemale_6562 [Volvox reticuliferus]GIL97527.1 hypothetical protein Vretimale_3165 [Volvox reticuliferus]
MTMEGRTVLLTGVTGYVGSELARQLLEARAHLRCPVRCRLNSPRLSSLKRAFDTLPGTITFVDADIRSEDAIAQVAAGCEYVFHVASPFLITAEDPSRDIVAPAVEGTASVLRGAARHKGNPLKRVVVTSSVCAIHDCNAKQEPRAGSGRPYTEEDWNEVSTVEAEPYWVSKVEAERIAWRLADELGLELVTVLPNFVMGPVVAPEAANGISVSFFRGFVEAHGGADPRPPPSGSWVFTDVRDVAAAHVLAALTPAAAGRRYIVSQPRSMSAKSVTDVLKASAPQLTHLPDGEPGTEEEKIDGSRVVRELGLQYTPLDRTLIDMAESLIRLGLAVPAVATATPVASQS